MNIKFNFAFVDKFPWHKSDYPHIDFLLPEFKSYNKLGEIIETCCD